MMSERFPEAETSMRMAIRVDPLSSLRRQELAELCAFTGRPEEGIAILDSVLRHDPKCYMPRLWRGICHMYAGNLGAAANDLDEAISIVDRLPLPVAMRALVHVYNDETESAREILEELRTRATHEYVDPYYLFSVCLLVDGFDAAFPYLEQMLETRSFFLTLLRPVPRYKVLRSDPRFLNALRTVWPDDF